MDLQEFTKTIRSILNLYPNTGATYATIRTDYQEFEEQPLGYTEKEFYNFMCKLENVSQERDCHGIVFWRSVSENTKHIRDMIVQQRSQHKPNRGHRKSGKFTEKFTGHDLENHPPKRVKVSPIESLRTSHKPLESTRSSRSHRPIISYADLLTDLSVNLSTNDLLNDFSADITMDVSGDTSSYMSFEESAEITDITEIIEEEVEYDKSNSPHIYGYQLIGDDFFLDLARLELGFQCRGRIQQSGMCISGQTIRGAIERINSLPENSLAEKVILNIGTEDLLNGRDVLDIQTDYRELMTRLKYDGIHIIITTLAPIPNHGSFSKIKTNWEKFNHFLRKQRNCENIAEKMIQNGKVIFSYYQDDVKYVSGSKQPHLLWSGKGRHCVLKYLKSFLIQKL